MRLFTFFSFFNQVFEIQCVFCTYSTYQFSLAPFEGLGGHTWLVVTILNNVMVSLYLMSERLKAHALHPVRDS